MDVIGVSTCSSKAARAHVQRLVSVVKMATLLEECNTERQRSVMRFLWTKGFYTKDIHKGMFSVCGGKCLSRIAVQNRLKNSLRDVRKLQMMSDKVRKCLRQQSKDFYAASFDALVK
jgi:hypothetical protein